MIKNSLEHRGIDHGLIRCLHCGKTVFDSPTCPRCGSKISARRPRSLEVSLAFLLTAIFLLIPANILPITQMTAQGKTSYDTIYSGILTLVNNDLLPIAIIVFIASILVPLIKIVGISILLITIKFRLKMSRQQLTTGYHIIEYIGRWSMLDLFVISIVATLLNIGQLLYAKPAPAATFFALVVLFTQLSAKALDPRLLWDLERDTD